MTDHNYTDITIVLDRSGSMAAVAPDTIGGYNTFLKEQKALPGKATLTLVQFDNEYEVVYRAVGIQDVPELTDRSYNPRGSTALLDAMGKAISETGTRLRNMPEETRPARIVLVVLTDGEENCSREYTIGRLKDMVEEQKTKYNWLIVFLGANMDAFAVGGGYGIARGTTSGYHASGIGTRRALADISRGVENYRLCSDAPVASSFDFFNRGTPSADNPVIIPDPDPESK